MNEHGREEVYRVAKLGYSVRPWRIILDPCPNGDDHRSSRCICEVWTSEDFNHPNLGITRIASPMSFQLKRDALKALAEMNERLGGLA